MADSRSGKSTSGSGKNTEHAAVYYTPRPPQQISNLASGYSQANVSRAGKNTENRTGAHIASILAISLSFPERFRVHLG